MLFFAGLKRIVPFLLTFAVGLFIASFFVSVTSPSLNLPRRSYKFREMQRLRQDNMDLRRANDELRRQLEEVRRDQHSGFTFDTADLPPDAPPPPPPPRRKHPRFDN